MERKIYPNPHCKTKQNCKQDCRVIPLLIDLTKAEELAITRGVTEKKAGETLMSGVARVKKQSGRFRCPKGEVDYQIRDIVG